MTLNILLSEVIYGAYASTCHD